MVGAAYAWLCSPLVGVVMQLQNARRLITVRSRWHWVTDGSAVLNGKCKCSVLDAVYGGLKVA